MSTFPKPDPLIAVKPPSNPLSDAQKTLRQTLRAELMAKRKAFEQSPEHTTANQALSQNLRQLLQRTQPESLGLYWYLPGEFNAVAAVLSAPDLQNITLALPYAQRDPKRMHYRSWNRQPPTSHDECRIPSSEGPPLIPQMVLVPCVGYTLEGFRLGYGGGYFDRWLAENPGTVAVGLAWSCTQLGADEFVAQGHDWALTGMVTEKGIIQI